MAGYHPIFSGLWNDDALEGLPFECKGFFAFLCTNERVRPSGIYRVSDAQLVVETELPLKRIRTHLGALSERRRIVRDGAWLFVQGYLKRQPKHERLLAGARQDVDNCASIPILEAFGTKYPLLSKWSTDRLRTVGRPRTETVPNSPQLQIQIQSYSLDRLPDGPPPGGLLIDRTEQQDQAPGPDDPLTAELAKVQAKHPSMPEADARRLAMKLMLGGLANKAQA